MTTPEIRIPVDPSNPGQFIACCGLFELADRLWGGVEAWFADGEFLFRAEGDGSKSLPELLRAFREAEAAAHTGTGDDDDMEADDEDGAEAVDPIELGAPFRLRLDWWADKSLKPWAGSMDARLIFSAMTRRSTNGVQTRSAIAAWSTTARAVRPRAAARRGLGSPRSVSRSTSMPGAGRAPRPSIRASRRMR